MCTSNFHTQVMCCGTTTAEWDARFGGFSRIFINRLPVDHTHEDINLKFAFIWKRVRNALVLTPLAYRNAIEGCLTSSRIKCEVKDVFVLPNYEKYNRDYLVPDFGWYVYICIHM